MKRLKLSIAAVLGLVSCSMEEQLQNNPASGNCIEISIETVVPSTKTTLSGEQLVWTGKESLDVLIGNTESTNAESAKSVALKINPQTSTFSGTIDLVTIL